MKWDVALLCLSLKFELASSRFNDTLELKEFISF